MQEIINDLANNNYVIIGLGVLLGVLIILFFIILLSGKKKKVKDVKVNVEESIVGETNTNNIDFDHNEYVKETTAEFELTPITELKPTPDEFVPDVKYEETPAINVNNKTVEDIPLADFNFDELSKSISEELDKLRDNGIKTEEELTSNTTDDAVTLNTAINSVSEANNVDAFKEVNSDIKPVEVTSVNNIPEPINLNPVQGPVYQEPANNEPSFITDYSDIKPNTEVAPTNSDPVIKEETTPLFTRFNQETYDINKKD